MINVKQVVRKYALLKTTTKGLALQSMADAAAAVDSTAEQLSFVVFITMESTALLGMLFGATASRDF